MRTAWLALVASVGIGAFFVGRYVGQRPIAGLQSQLAQTQHERDLANELQHDVGTSFTHALSGTARPSAPIALSPAAPFGVPLVSTHDEVNKLLDRLNELNWGAPDGGTYESIDMKAEHARNASKLRDDFFAKANLDGQQREAIEPIVAELDRTIKAPLDKLAALEDADHYAVSDWAQARVEVYQAIASSEQQLRALLSPQQREALDQTNFSLSSQLGEDHYGALVERGLVTYTDDAEESVEPFAPNR